MSPPEVELRVPSEDWPGSRETERRVRPCIMAHRHVLHSCGGLVWGLPSPSRGTVALLYACGVQGQSGSDLCCCCPP